jgi:hypothetical protein
MITNSALRCIDPNTPFTLTLDGNPVDLSTDLDSMNFEFGRIQFVASETDTLTITGSYIPLGVADLVEDVKSFSVSESSEMLDRTVFTDGTALRRRFAGLMDVQISMELIMSDASVPTFRALGESPVLLEINYDADTRFRGWGVIESIEMSASVDGLVEASVTWNVSAQRNAATGFLAGYSDLELTPA